jgi:DNA repair exonuclease SbcCD ATPase subunit
MRTSIFIALAATACLAACTNQQQPAENAVAKIQASLDEVRADAQKYAPDQLQTVETSVSRLKENLTKKDYSGVVVGAPSVASEVDGLRSTVATAKADAEANLAAAQTEWNDLSASVPPLVEKLQARVDQLSKTRRYPKGMDKAAFEAAKNTFEGLKNEWTEASNEFTSGEAGNAVRKARNAKSKAEELINQLEVKV